MILASDNWAGASPKIASAIAEAASGFRPAYGGDDISATVEALFCDVFEREVKVFIVATGTAANALAVSAFGGPGGVVLCHEDAHIATDEAGAVAFFGGGLTFATLAGEGGRIAPDALAARLAGFPAGFVHHGQPRVLSVTNLTEWGQTYAPDEVAALAAVAHERGLAVHMDGARFAGAVASLDVAPADITWRAGVDVLSFGGTKNGCLAAEAVVFFDPEKARDFAYARQRAGHGLSKAWVAATQFRAYLDNGHWLELARHANRAGAEIARIVEATPDARLALTPAANQVFARLSANAEARLEGAGVRFYRWGEPDADGTVTVRLVTSFMTSEADLAVFRAAMLG